MIMNDLKAFISAAIGATLGAVGTATQTNETLETISLIVTIIGAILSFIVCPLLSWFNQAKKDGHIDNEEIEELTKDISKGINEIGDALDEHKKGDK